MCMLHAIHCHNVYKLRAVPEIILGGGPHLFSDPSPPRTHMESEPPNPQRHVSALINPHPTMDQICLDPQDKLTPPTPQTCQQNTLPPQDKEVPAAHSPEDKFWNSPKTGNATANASTKVNTTNSILLVNVLKMQQNEQEPSYVDYRMEV